MSRPPRPRYEHRQSGGITRLTFVLGLLAMPVVYALDKKRKYYRITAKGRATLKGILPKLEELADEVLPSGAGGHAKRKRHAVGRQAR